MSIKFRAMEMAGDHLAAGNNKTASDSIVSFKRTWAAAYLAGMAYALAESTDQSKDLADVIEQQKRIGD